MSLAMRPNSSNREKRLRIAHAQGKFGSQLRLLLRDPSSQPQPTDVFSEDELRGEEPHRSDAHQDRALLNGSHGQARRGKSNSSFRIRHGLKGGNERSVNSEQVSPNMRLFKHSAAHSKGAASSNGFAGDERGLRIVLVVA